MDDTNVITMSRTELDSHANMAVVGKHAEIISHTGEVAEVNPFTPDYKPMSIPIVDAAIQYDCPFEDKQYILVIRNALHVPSMNNNLIPPFMLREAGVLVKETPKIQVEDPRVDDHAITFPDTGFRIPLSLNGVFSYFNTSKPTTSDMQDSTNVYMISPSRWNPHDTTYARCEASMLDWEGNMVEKKDRMKVLLSEIEENTDMAQSSIISGTESGLIDARVMDDTKEDVHPQYHKVPRDADQVASTLANVSPIYDDQSLHQLLEERGETGRMSCAIGATTVPNSDTIFGHDDPADKPDTSDDDSDVDISDAESDSSQSSTLSDILDKLYDESLSGQVDLDEIMVSATHANPRKGVDAEHLSKIWRIDLETARRTLEVTTQRSNRVDNPTLSRNYGTNDRMLRYKRLDEYFFMDTFFATKKAGKSTRSNTCCQLFVTDKGFVYVVPMKSKAEVLQAVKQFAKEVGAPDALICDAAGEQTSQAMRKFCTEIGTTLRALEEGTPWANKAELYIGLIKAAVSKDMKESNCPLVLWDYCVERRARINNLTAKDSFKLHGTTSQTALTGEEGDISNLCTFKWYEWCYYREQTNKFPFNQEVLGRVLGPAKGKGNEMAQWILKANGNVVPRQTVRPLNVAEKNSDIELNKRKIFDSLIERRWGNPIMPPKTTPSYNPYEVYEDDDEKPRIMPEIEESVDASGTLMNQQPAYDKMINAEIQLQKDNEMAHGRVKRRALGPDGRVCGTYDDNPMMNSIIYEVEFPDGEVKEYAANVIGENMLTQVDSEGFTVTMMDGIIDHAKNEAVAVPKSDMYVVTPRGQRRLKKSTAGWQLQVQWKDKSESWIPLKDLKESHPVEVAEYARARGIADEPAFAWWVPHTLRKRDIILAAVKSRIRKKTHKYGIEIPTSVAHAYAIDQKNGNTFWRDAISKEMTDAGIAFKILEESQATPVGWSKATGHLVFDVKMDFTRKARWVLDGHKTQNPEGSTYAGVVSRESVRIALTYAALNGLNVCAADIKNAYLQAPSSEKHFIICGPEFGLENVGKRALIVRALYGGKSAGKDFRNHLRDCMRHLGFKSCPADPDVWMRPAKHSRGSDYYEYILLYTDDALAISENAEQLLRQGIGKYFELKEKSIGPPKIYLGSGVREVTLENGATAWAFSPSQYVQAAVKNVETYLSNQDTEWKRIPSRAETPMQTNYRPELDVSPALGPVDAAYYQSLIGILRWMVEIGRVDICLEVSMMSSHLALPRQGHFAQVLHIFAHLKKYHNTKMVFDPSDPVVDMADFELKDWASSEFGHLQGKEELPPNMPEPRGQGFVMRAKVDADHAGDTITRRSRTGFLVYLNCAPIYWMSKKQTSIESSSFGSEFIAMKQCCEYIRGLRYKLRMMGIPCEGPTYIYGDNQSVLANTSIPDSTLKKKSQSIAYHYVREGTARDEWRLAYVHTSKNEADLLTKLLPHGDKRKGFVRNLLHHIYQTSGDV